MDDKVLNELIERFNLKYIVRNYKLTIEQIKKYIVTHPMNYENDDVSPYFVTICQSHLSKEEVYNAFKN